MGHVRRVAWFAAVAVLAGCGSVEGLGLGGGDRLRKQAEAALERYDAAVRAAGGSPRFVPVGELTGIEGHLEPRNDLYKESLAAGKLVAAGKLPAAPRPSGDVVFADETRVTLPLLPAEQALAEMVDAGTADCGECEVLTVTGARLGSVRMATIKGEATVPAWVFTVKGTAIRVTRPAVDGAVTVTPPPWDPYDGPAGLSVESASIAGGNRLTVSFTGTPGTGDEPCGADYTAEAVESANAVAVIVRAEPHDASGSCDAIGAPRGATVELAAPLGERAVLEVVQGLPVPLTAR